MERRARCRICNETIIYKDPGCLGAHLLKKHPQSNPSFYSVATSPINVTRKNSIESQTVQNLLSLSCAACAENPKNPCDHCKNQLDGLKGSGVKLRESSCVINSDNRIFKVYCNEEDRENRKKSNKKHVDIDCVRGCKPSVLCDTYQEDRKSKEKCGKTTKKKKSKCSLISLCSKPSKSKCRRRKPKYEVCPGNIPPCIRESEESQRRKKNKQIQETQLLEAVSPDCQRCCELSKLGNSHVPCSVQTCPIVTKNRHTQAPRPQSLTSIRNYDEGSSIEKPGSSANQSSTDYKKYSQREQIPKCEPKTCYRKRLFKTTVTSWKSGNKLVLCPHCREEVVPVVKKKKNNVTNHSILSYFMLGCWPLCFLCPMSFRPEANYYCPQCRKAIILASQRNDVPNISTGPNCSAQNCPAKSK